MLRIVATIAAKTRVELLARASLFAGIGAEPLAQLAAAARTRNLAKRDELFHKGDEGRQIYAVVKGRLKALTTSREGDDVVFTIFGPGEVFGEIALLCGTRRTATVSALEACELLVIDHRAFFDFLRRTPDVAIAMMRVLAERTARLSELVEDTLFLNLPLRLAKRLMGLARIYGEKTPAGLRVDLKLSQEEWGDLVGSTRESVNKQIRVWTDQGIVSVDRGYIVIHNPDALDQLAGAIAV